MTYAVIIRGPLGIGKSTISRRLARSLHGRYISVDIVLEKHGLAKVENDYVPADFIKANEIILPAARKELVKNRVVVFDGNFYFREQIEHLIQNLPVQYYAFTLKAPLEVCIERDKKRKGAYGRDAAAAVHSLVSRFDYGRSIDTAGKRADEVLKDILSYLPKLPKNRS